MPSSSWIRTCLTLSVLSNIFWVFYFLFMSKSNYQIQADYSTGSVLNGRRILYSSPNKTSRAAAYQSIDYNSMDTREMFNRLDHKLQQKPYIFIGGVPSSGTTLARAILDAHPNIRCGEETRLIPRILQMSERWNRSPIEHRRLSAAGLNDSVITKVLRNFVSSVIEFHGPKAEYLCNKDPLSLSQMTYLHTMFPNAKFLLLIRDGRAVANSIVSRNVSITGVDHKSFLSTALFWNKIMTKMVAMCDKVGSEYCYKLRYETLVEDTGFEAKKLVNFLGIPWSDNLLHHSDFLGSEVKLSKFEPSTKQVSKAITQKSVDKWKMKIPVDIQRKIWERCPMLKKLGYEQ